MRKQAVVHGSSLVFVLLGAVVLVAIVAKRLELPYPIAFVVGGSAFAFAPALPPLTLDPQWVFLIFLPPLLFSGGWLVDFKLLKQNARPVGLLAIGLVVFTTSIVAVVAHALLPQLGWAGAFVLGAVISPPDAVAAGAVFERFTAPARIIAILEGEGLVNDATALVIYRFAIAAAVTGAFSPARAGFAFVAVALGGIAIGVVWGKLFSVTAAFLRRAQLSDYLISNSLMILVPYAIYTSAEATGASGVLATVVAGVYVSRHANTIFDAESRLVSSNVWELLIFFFNGLAFLLIGLQLRAIVHDPAFARRELAIGLEISALVIAIRLAWVFPAAYLPRILVRRIREREPYPSWRYIFVIGWSGMRGIVSLASALAIPVATASGAPFPGRDEIVFITFCVIFVTLVGQGLSLIPILRWLDVSADEDVATREIEVRVTALRAGIARLRELEPRFESTDEWEVEGRILGEYEYRIAHLTGHLDGSISVSDVAVDHRMQGEALQAERNEIARLRDDGAIPDEIFRKVQYDLDLADERLS